MSARDLAVRLLISARDQASSVIGAIANKWTALSAALGAFVGARFLGSAIGEAAQLQQQFAALQAATGATAEQVAQLKAEADALGADDTLSVSALQAAEGMTELARAGQSTQETLAAIRPVIALAQGAKLGLGEAAGIVTANLAAFQLAADQSGRVADVLSTAASSAKTTVAALASALSYAAPAAHAAGMSIEQTAALIAKMQHAGIDASRAGTALNAMLAQLADPASTASKALDQAGIATRDFSAVLAALEQGAPAAQKAIVSFGTEAGPALRALLAQGAGSVRELQAALEQASGSAERSAAVMNDNLPGAMEALASVWDGLKRVLVEPLLAPLEREARALAATLAGFARSAQMEQLKQILVSTFETGVAQLRAFAAAIDWPAFARSVSGALSTVIAALRSWGENVDRVKDTVVLGFSSITTGIATLKAGFFGLAGVIATAVEWILLGFSKIVEGQSKLTFGPFKTLLQNTANELRTLSESFAESAQVNFQKAQDAIDDAAKHAETLREAWDGLNEAGDQAARGVDEVAQAQAQAAAKAQALIAAQQDLATAVERYQQAAQYAADTGVDASGSLALLAKNVAAAAANTQALAGDTEDQEAALRALIAAEEAYAAIAQDMVSATEDIGTAAEDARTRTEQLSQQINALEIAYKAFMAVGNTDMAATVRSQIESLREELEKTGKQAEETAAKTAAAFAAAGLQTREQLTELATKSKATYEQIRDSGQATPQVLQQAFTQYAEAAIAANGGVADETLRAEAAQLGLAVQATATGGRIVDASQQAAQSQRDVAQAAREADDQLQQTGQSAEKAADSLTDAGGAASAMRLMYESVVAGLAGVSEKAAKAVDSIVNSVETWNRKVAEIRNLSGSDFVGLDDVSRLNADLAALQAQAEKVAEEARNLQRAWTGAFNVFGEFYTGLGAIKELEAETLRAEAAAKRAEIAISEMSAALDDLSDAHDRGELGLSEYLTKLERLRGQYARLTDEEMEDLLDKIGEVQAALADQASAAAAGVTTWRERLAGAKDDLVAIQQLEWHKELTEAKIALIQAERDGNQAAIADLKEQIRLINEYYDFEVQQAAKEEADDAIEAAEDAAKEAERRANLTQAERDYEDQLAALTAELAAAIEAGNTAAEQALLKQILALKAAWQDYLKTLKESVTDPKLPDTDTAQRASSSAERTPSAGARASGAASTGVTTPSTRTVYSAPQITINLQGDLLADTATFNTFVRRVRTELANLERRGA